MNDEGFHINEIRMAKARLDRVVKDAVVDGHDVRLGIDLYSSVAPQVTFVFISKPKRKEWWKLWR